MPFQIIQEKITKLDVEAVVSSDDAELSHTGGVSWAIAQAAGEGRIQRFAQLHIPLEVSKVVVSEGYNLKADYIIHASVPENNQPNVEKLLSQTYKNIFKEVKKLGIHSIALPLLSAGQFGVPKDLSMQLALNEIRNFLKDLPDTEIFIALHNQDVDRIPYEIYEDLKEYLDENLQTEFSLYDALEASHYQEEREFRDKAPTSLSEGLEKKLNNLEDPFKIKLFQLIDKRGLKDATVYHKANISRKLFSKIRTQDDYTPKKTTIFALLIALECSHEESNDLLKSAGYSFNPSKKTDMIVEYFIVNQNYDIFTINETLYEFKENQLI